MVQSFWRWGRVWLVMMATSTAIALPAFAFPIVETFDTDTADVTDGSYPDFELNEGAASVSGGVLRLGGGNFVQRFTREGSSGDLTISGQIQAATFGAWNVGMEFGSRRFIFHPGYAGGAFRIEDASLGSRPLGVLLENTNMGFTPSTTAFHIMELMWNSSLNQVMVSIKDGDGIAAPFTLNWTPDAGFNPIQRIGFTYDNQTGGSGIGFFDNLTIIPEPSTALLVSLGLTGLSWKGRRSLRS